ncbi:hypothetical protein G3341_08615 [Providencia vermicola]|uniref:hypothetical protein n=1 Tax=Providencia vermicola TaxID=333965 RepID=UPI0013A72922|nr:hypothetical protein [Providencia vermicola]QIC14183.1 hypothetical protein G3341_08615 [Providencia vermicola]
MSDKKEIATLSIKISVDSTDLDKLEAQLKRIEGLMVSAGLKQPASVGFSADKFFIASGQVLINETLVTSGTITSAKVQGPAIAKVQCPAIDDALRQAAEKGAIEGTEQALLKVTTGVNHNDDQLSSMAKLDDTDREIKETGATGILDRIRETLHSSGNKAVIAALDKVIDINPPVSREEFQELRRIVESELSQLYSSLADIRASMIRSEAAANNRLLQMQKEIDGARSIWR